MFEALTELQNHACIILILKEEVHTVLMDRRQWEE